MLKVSSPEILEYRKAIEERKLDLPIWERKVITCEEAAAYSGIGIKRLRKMALAKGCNFSISNGTQILINRKRSIITRQGQKKKHLGQEVQKIR